MARGRHAKPSGLLSRLFPGRTARRRAAAERERARVRALHDEVLRLRAVGTALAAEAATAAARARRAEESAAAARAEIADLRAESGALRDELARLREEMLWAWADGRLPAVPAVPAAAPEPARVIDLREAAGS
jgi:cell division protein FtsB